MNGHKTYVSWRECQSAWQPPVRGPIQNSSAELSWEPPWPNPSKKARLGTLCHIVSRCVTLCCTLHEHCTCIARQRQRASDQNRSRCVLPHLDYTTATIARKCSDPFWHVATTLRQRCDSCFWLLQMVWIEFRLHQDWRCLRRRWIMGIRPAWSCLCHDMSWLKTFQTTSAIYFKRLRMSGSRFPQTISACLCLKQSRFQKANLDLRVSVCLLNPSIHTESSYNSI